MAFNVFSRKSRTLLIEVIITKTLFRLVVLSALVFGSTAALINANALSKDASGDSISNDNKNKKRNRRSDDSNSNSSNSNSNSNANSNSNTEPSTSGVSRDEARRIALKAVSGQIVKEELETKRGRSTYEFYIRKSNGKMFEVYVDAETGKVVKLESESDDNS